MASCCGQGRTTASGVGFSIVGVRRGRKFFWERSTTVPLDSGSSSTSHPFLLQVFNGIVRSTAELTRKMRRRGGRRDRCTFTLLRSTVAQQRPRHVGYTRRATSEEKLRRLLLLRALERGGVGGGGWLKAEFFSFSLSAFLVCQPEGGGKGLALLGLARREEGEKRERKKRHKLPSVLFPLSRLMDLYIPKKRKVEGVRLFSFSFSSPS